MSNTRDFFKKQAEHSRAKTEIVAEYFAAWMQILKGSCDVLSYLDLFSGPGKYVDGTPSTPIRVLDEIQKVPGFQSRIRLAFYENNAEFFAELENNIHQHPVTNQLQFVPELKCEEITHQSAPNLPIDDCTFTFIDPWGYKEVTLDLLSAVVDNFGNDCLFYLSITGIHRNLKFPNQEQHLTRLFGSDGLRTLKEHGSGDPNEKHFHQVVIEELSRSLCNTGIAKRNYFVPFAVEADHRHQVQHYLCFLTKHPTGFRKMKDVMAKHSHFDADGFPLFHWTGDTQITIPFESKLKQTAEKLAEKYRGRRIQVGKLVDECHQNGYMCLSKNVKCALELLLESERLEIIRDFGRRRRKGTFSDKLVVKFT
ncbi:MAG: three-Cys-motif partner protein TcmP [candidate division Zixibacteria bacterium]|nr:three-Cys-motif partner protein TcmP [candidate division Zixibacteria bacterium]